MEIRAQLSQSANRLLHVINSGRPNDYVSLETARSLLIDLARPGREDHQVVLLEVEIGSELGKWFGTDYPDERHKTHPIARQLQQKILQLHRAVVAHLDRKGK